MVGIISHDGLGLFDSSMDRLGGAQGQPTNLGQAKGSAYVNVATGNLSVQFLDENLSGKNSDLFALRTYNSQGNFTNGIHDGDNDGWRWLGEKRVVLTGTLNNASSTVMLTLGDGGTSQFKWLSTNKYQSTDGAGAHDILEWNAATSEWILTENGGSIQHYFKSSDGWISKTRDTTGTGVGFDYVFTSNKLTSVTDIATGQRLDFIYGGDGKLSELKTFSKANATDAGSLLKQVSYVYHPAGVDGAGMLWKVTTDLTPANTTDNLIYTTEYTYYADKKVKAISQSDGTSASFTYDTSNRISTVTDQTGTSTFTYDVSSSRTFLQTGRGDSWAYQYDATTKQLKSFTSSMVNNVGQTASYDYYANGDVKTISNGTGNTITYTYDTNGNRTKEVDTLGNTITRTFGAKNELLTETRYAVASVSSPGGAETTRHVYDTANRLRFVITPEGRVTEHNYNTFGLLTSTRQYAGKVYGVGGLAINVSPTLTNLTDWAAALTTTEKQLQQLIEFAYDYRGNLEKKTAYAKVNSTGAGDLDSAADVSKFIYDEYGLLRQTIALRGASRTTEDTFSSYTYDGMGRLLNVVNESGATTTTYSGLTTSVTNTVRGLTVVTTTDASGRVTDARQTGDASNASGGSNVQNRITKYYYDNAGQLRMTEDPTGARNYLFYDHAGRVIAKVDPAGAVIGYTHDKDGRVLTEVRYANKTNPSGWFNGTTVTEGGLSIGASGTQVITDATYDRKTTYTYDVAGRLSTTTVDGTATITNTYDGASRLTQTVQGDRITKYYYDKDGRQVGVLDAERYLTQYVYDHAGRVTLVVRYGETPATVAQQTSATFDSIRTTVNNGARLSTYNFYDALGRLVGVVNEQGFLTETIYDAVNNQRKTNQYKTAVTVSESNSFVILETLDAVKARAGAYNTTTTQYDSFGRIVSVTSTDGSVSRNVYDATGRLIRQIQAEGTSEQRASRTRYNAFNETTGLVSGQGESTLSATATAAEINTAISNYGTRYDIDGAGRKIAEYQPNGQKTLMYYNAAGQLEYTVNALGEVSQMAYNTFGQVASLRVYTGRISISGLIGGLTNSTLTTRVNGIAQGSNDKIVTTLFNRLGLVYTTTDANGYQTVKGYNNFGEQESERRYITNSPSTSVLNQFGRDKLGRVVWTKQDMDSGGANLLSQQKTYDGFGRVKTNTDANGRVTATNYQFNGRVIEIIDPMGRNTKTELDFSGRTLKSFDSLGNVTSYNFDDVSRSIAITSPDGVAVTTWKNRHGDTIQIRNGNGHDTIYTFNKNGTLESVIDPEGIKNEYNQYDNSGRLWRVADANGAITQYTYDVADRIIEKAVDYLGLNLRTRYEFDGQGRKLSVIEGYGTADATKTQYIYDRKGQVSQIIVDPDGLKLSTKITYDGLGQTTKVEKGTVGDPSQQITIYNFDKLGRKTSEQVDPTGLNLITSYQYDNNGNLSRKIDPRNNYTSYIYDRKNRLQFSINAEGAVSENIYDANGNVIGTVQYDKLVSPTTTYTEHSLKTALASWSQGFGANASGYTLPATNFSVANGQLVMTSVKTAAGTPSDFPQAWGTTRLIGTGFRYQFSTDGVTNNHYGTIGINSTDWKRRHAINQSGGSFYVEYVDGSGTVKSQLLGSIKDNTKYVLEIETDSGGSTLYLYEEGGSRATGFVDRRNYSDWKDAATWLLTGSVSTFASNTAISIDAVQEFFPSNARKTQYVYDKANRLRFTVTAEGGVSENVYDANGNVVSTVQYDKLVNPATSYTEHSLKAALASWSQGFDANASGYTLPATNFSVVNGQLVMISVKTATGTPSDFPQAWGTTRTIGTGFRYQFSTDGVTNNHYGTIGINSTDWKRRHAVNQSGGSFYAEYVDGSNAVKSQLLGSIKDNTKYILEIETDSEGSTLYLYEEGGSRTSGFVDRRNYSDWKDAATWLLTGSVSTLASNTAVTIDAVQEFFPSNTRKTQYVYDKANRLRFTVNAEGGVSENVYDGNGNIKQTTQYAGIPGLQGDYTLANVNGRVNKTDVNNRTTNYVYDRANRLKFTINPEGAINENVYDAEGNVQQTTQYASIPNLLGDFSETNVSARINNTDVNNRRTNYVYDRANRLQFTVNTEGAVSENIYDANSNVIGTVQHDKLVSPTTTYTEHSLKTALASWSQGFGSNASGYTLPATNFSVANGQLVMTSVKTAAGTPSDFPQAWGTTRLIGTGFRYQFSTDGVTNNHYGTIGINSTDWKRRHVVNQSGGSFYVEYVDGSGTVKSQLLGSIKDNTKYVLEIETDSGGSTLYLYEEGGSRATGFVDRRNYSDWKDVATWLLTGSVSTFASNTVINIDAVQEFFPSNARKTQYVYDKANRLRFTVNAEGAVSENIYDANGNVVRTVQYANKLSAAEIASVTALKAIYSTNRLINSTFSVSASETSFFKKPEGWISTPAGNVIVGGVSVNLEPARTVQGLPDGDNTLWIGQEGSYANMDPVFHRMGQVSQSVPVNVGTKYAFSVYAAAVNAQAQLLLVWRDANGNALGTISDSTASAAGGTSINNYARLMAVGVAPSGAVSAEVIIRKSDTYAGYSNSSLSAVHAQFEEIPASANQATEWVKSLSLLKSDPADRVTNYEYDKANRQTKTTMAGWYDVTDGRVYAFGENQSDRFQRTIEVTYDIAGNAIANKIRVGISDYVYQYKTYDKLDREINDVDALGYVTQKAYYATGDVKSVTRSANSIGEKTSGYWTNDAIGAVTGRAINYQYDKIGRQIKITQPTTGATGFRSKWGDSTNGSLVTYSSASVIDYTYDALGNLLKQSQLIDDSNRRAESYFYYDKVGRQVLAVDAEKFGLKTEYNVFGDVTKATEYSVATTSSISTSAPPVFLDTLSDYQKTTLGNNRISVYTYDRLGKGKTTSQFINGQETLLNTKNYNAFGEVFESIDVVDDFNAVVNNKTTMEYNRVGLVTKITEPARMVAGTSSKDVFIGQVSSAPVNELIYNSFGNLTSESRGSNTGLGGVVTTTHTLDFVGNEVGTKTKLVQNGSTIFEDRTESITLYDVTGRVIGQRQSVKGQVDWVSLHYDHIVERRFEYDKTGRQVATYDLYEGGTKKSGQYNEYNGYGEITFEKKFWGSSTESSFNLKNNLASSVIVNRYEYDNAGRVKLKQSSEGYIYYYYDLAGRATRIEQRESETNTTTQRVTENYHDLLGRTITQRLPQYQATATNSLGSEITSMRTPRIFNTYDRWGNLISRMDPANRETKYTYNLNNQLLTETGPSVEAIKLNGEIISTQQEHKYSYNKQGNVVAESFVSYQVNPYGGSILLGAHTSTNTYNNVGQLLMTKDATANVYEPNLIFDFFNPGQLVTTGVVQRYSYDIHGNKVGSKNASGHTTISKYDHHNRIVGEYLLRDYVQVTPTAYMYQEYTGSAQGAIHEIQLHKYLYDDAGRKNVDYGVTGFATGFGFDYTAFDERGNIVGTMDRFGIRKTYTFDELGNKTGDIGFEDSHTWNFKDTNNDFVDYKSDKAQRHTTSDGNIYEYSYTNFGQLKSERSIHPVVSLNPEITYAYWENGLLKSVREELSYSVSATTTINTSSYYYDNKGNRTADLTKLEYVENAAQGGVLDAHVKVAGNFYSFYQYDAQNRLTKVVSPSNNFKIANVTYNTTDVNYIDYQYDEWGNRRKISSRYALPGKAVTTREEWFTYDEMNRVLIEGGINVQGAVVIYKDAQGISQGVKYGYDTSGRRRTEERHNGTETNYEKYKLQHFIYNDIGLIKNIKTFNNQRALNANSSQAYTYSELWPTEETFTYNDNGFKTSSSSSADGNTYYFYYDNGSINYTTNDRSKTKTQYFYDLSGSVSSYIYYQYSDTALTQETFHNTYTYTYVKTYAGRKQKKISVVSSQGGTGEGTTENLYDARGRHMASSRLDKHPTKSKTGNTYLSFVYNTSGQILNKSENKYDDSSDYLTQNYYYSPSGGELANLGAISGVDISPLDSVNAGADSPINYTVNAGDTLMGISQALFGDTRFWYLIADANGLKMGPTDAFGINDIGRNIRIPNTSKNIGNTSSNWKPFNPGEVIGDLTPNPKILPPPKKGGCGVIGMIIMVVVAVVLTIVTAGAFAAAAGTGLAGMFSAGTAVLAGTSTALTTAGMIGAAMVGGFVGSVGSQLVGMAMGVVDHFSLRQAVGSGLTAGFAAGAGSVLSASQTMATLANATKYGHIAATAAVNYVGSYAANKIAGLDVHFSWSSMAAASLTAMGTTAVSQGLGISGDGFTQKFSRGVIGAGVGNVSQRLIGNGKTLHGSDWGNIAADSFGNALANEIVDYTINSSSIEELHPRQKQVYDAKRKQGMSRSDALNAARKKDPFDGIWLASVESGANEGEAVLDASGKPTRLTAPSSVDKEPLTREQMLAVINAERAKSGLQPVSKEYDWAITDLHLSYKSALNGQARFEDINAQVDKLEQQLSQQSYLETKMDQLADYFSADPADNSLTHQIDTLRTEQNLIATDLAMFQANMVQSMTDDSRFVQNLTTLKKDLTSETLGKLLIQGADGAVEFAKNSREVLSGISNKIESAQEYADWIDTAQGAFNLPSKLLSSSLKVFSKIADKLSKGTDKVLSPLNKLFNPVEKAKNVYEVAQPLSDPITLKRIDEAVPSARQLEELGEEEMAQEQRNKYAPYIRFMDNLYNSSNQLDKKLTPDGE